MGSALSPHLSTSANRSAWLCLPFGLRAAPKQSTLIVAPGNQPLPTGSDAGHVTSNPAAWWPKTAKGKTAKSGGGGGGVYSEAICSRVPSATYPLLPTSLQSTSRPLLSGRGPPLLIVCYQRGKLDLGTYNSSAPCRQRLLAYGRRSGTTKALQEALQFNLPPWPNVYHGARGQPNSSSPPKRRPQ